MYPRLLILAILFSTNLQGQSPKMAVGGDSIAPKVPLSSISLRLKRLKFTKVEIPFLNTLDTFFLFLNNQDQIPFKKVKVKIQGGVREDPPYTKISSLSSFFIGVQPQVLLLKIKPVFSLRRQFANITVHKRQVLDSAAIAACRQKRDSLLKANLDASLDPKNPLGSKRPDTIGDSIFKKTWRVDTLQIPGKKQVLFENELTLVPKPAETRSIVVKDFKAGDTLTFSVKATKPLKSIWLEKDRKKLTESANLMEWSHTLVAQDTHSITLFFKGFSSIIHQKNPTQIRITKSEPTIVKQFLTVVDSIFLKKITTVHDTVLFPVIDQSLNLSPVWDIENVPFGQIEVQIPLNVAEGYGLKGIAYWLGIERVCLDNYIKLEATVPPDWSKPGVPPALGAFALGRSIVFPAIGNVELAYNFSKKPLIRDKFGRISGLPNSTPLKLNAGFIPLNDLSSFCSKGWSQANNVASYNFFACFRNKSTANPYPVQLKVLGMYCKSISTLESVAFNSVKTVKKELIQ